MAIHPPSLYVGFVAMTIPFAFGIAALITGHLDEAWLRAVRRWTMLGWLALSFGLTLGMLWAYEELGWGGYWMWDPVENAGAPAVVHGHRVSALGAWCRSSAACCACGTSRSSSSTFFLTIFGTFMTRSGVVQSVHAFGEDRELAWLFTVFMVAILMFSFGWVIYRLPLLRSRHELDSLVSREAAFLANNWILLFSAFFVLFATMFPTLSEAVTGERLTVGPPFFNTWMLPIGLIAARADGRWPAARVAQVDDVESVEQLQWPVLPASSRPAALVCARRSRVELRASASRCAALVFGTIAQEFIRGAEVRREATGTDLVTAMIGLVGRSKRRYGGYIVHVGIVLMFLGFAGEGFKQEEQALLKPGRASHGRRTSPFAHDALRVTSDAQKQMVTGHVSVFEDGKALGTMRAGEVVLQQAGTGADDRGRDPPRRRLRTCTSSSPDTTRRRRAATYAVTVNPLVNWIWFGFAVMAHRDRYRSAARDARLRSRSRRCPQAQRRFP